MEVRSGVQVIQMQCFINGVQVMQMQRFINRTNCGGRGQALQCCCSITHGSHAFQAVKHRGKSGVGKSVEVVVKRCNAVAKCSTAAMHFRQSNTAAKVGGVGVSKHNADHAAGEAVQKVVV